jgi:aryl-alcohol dehydrogenase-like predicted oxidoreductase
MRAGRKRFRGVGGSSRYIQTNIDLPQMHEFRFRPAVARYALSVTLSRVASLRPTRIAAVQNKYNLLERQAVACLLPAAGATSSVAGARGSACAAEAATAPDPEKDFLARPDVASVIAGVTRMDQLEDNVLAAQVELSSPEMAELDAMSRQGLS